MPLGTFITTATVALAASAYDSVTHGLSTTPDMIWATLRSTGVDRDQTSSAVPIFAARGRNSASLTCYNHGQSAGTWTFCAAYFHSVIR